MSKYNFKTNNIALLFSTEMKHEYFSALNG